MTTRAALSEHRWLRFTTFTICYFAQGAPWGLISVAIPTYMAELKYPVSEIALYTSITGLPWALKLIGGPFMDRFKFPALGFRRPWVLMAQGGLTLSMMSLALIDFSGPLLPIMATGFVINAFAATQDVAVDGMAIDLLHPEERGRANALMGFGSVLGVSVFTGLGGVLLSDYGTSITAIVCTASVGAIFLFVSLVRERPGEKLMPWTAGAATSRPEIGQRAVKTIFRDLLRVMLLPMGLVLVAVEWIRRMSDGVALASFPAFATQELGFTTAQYSLFDANIGIAAALVGALLGTFMDRYGTRIFLLVSIIGSAICHLAMGILPSLWESTAVVIQIGLLAKIFGQLIFVAAIALFMTLCWSRVAATQFAIYMSLSNLSRVFGSYTFSTVADSMTFAQHFLLMGVLLAASAGLLLLFNQRENDSRLQRLEAA